MLSGARQLGLACLTAFLLIFSFPRFDFAFLAPIALAPLLVAAAGEHNPWRRLLMGEAAGIVYWFGACYWIQFVLAVHGGMGEAGGWGVFALFCLAKALHLAVFTMLAGPLMRRWYALPAIAALWAGLERTHGPLGFAWLALGNAGINMGVPMRLAPWTGVYGVSFVFAMTGAGLAHAALRRRRVELAWLLLLPMLYLLPELPQAAPPTESAVAVQPNIPQGATWTAGEAGKLRQRLAYLSLESALAPGLERPRMILWPEAPAPLYYYNDASLRVEIAKIVTLARAPMIAGTVAFSASNAPLNSAVAVSEKGEPVSRYDKMFLVPFGEYVPPLFGFVNRITQEAGDFEPGSKVVVTKLDGHGIGTFICYESAFPHLVRQFAREGGQVLVNLTNDGYFGKTSARQQHLLLARMRAAENRRWLLRPTNDGITVSIDPAGRIRGRIEPYEESVTRLGFSWVEEQTLYTRHGDWFAWTCLLAALAAVAVTLLL